MLKTNHEKVLSSVIDDVGMVTFSLSHELKEGLVDQTSINVAVLVLERALDSLLKIEIKKE